MGRGADPNNLTGLWHGRYGYMQASMEPVGFTASLVELGGSISGATHEQTPVTSAVTATLPAMVSGTRDGSSGEQAEHKVAEDVRA